MGILPILILGCLLLGGLTKFGRNNEHIGAVMISCLLSVCLFFLGFGLAFGPSYSLVEKLQTALFLASPPILVLTGGWIAVRLKNLVS